MRQIVKYICIFELFNNILWHSHSINIIIHTWKIRGTIIELVEPINDPFSPKPAGARFKVSEVDDACQLHGVWLPPESGSLAVDIEHDCYVKIE